MYTDYTSYLNLWKEQMTSLGSASWTRSVIPRLLMTEVHSIATQCYQMVVGQQVCLHHHHTQPQWHTTIMIHIQPKVPLLVMLNKMPSVIRH